MKEKCYLRELLENRGMTLRLLSRTSGVAYATIHGLFTGTKSIREAQAESVKRIADTLNITMDEFYVMMLRDVEGKDNHVMKNFSLMCRDQVVSDVIFDKEGVLVERFDLNPAKQIFYKNKLSMYEFGEIIRSRCWDEHRPDMGKLLNMLELSDYNPYEIVARTHGLMANDNIWFRFEGERINYKEVRRLRFDTGDYA